MTTALLAPASRRLSHLSSPSIVRPPYLLARFFSEYNKQIHHGNENSGTLKSIPVSTAFELVRNSGYTLLDVRTADEFKDGHPLGAMNIAYMLQTEAGMQKNPEFEQEVISSLKKDDQIIVGCRSGKRSLMAAADLVSLGFKHVVDLAGGYIAWTGKGLPVHKPE